VSQARTSLEGLPENEGLDAPKQVGAAGGREDANDHERGHVESFDLIRIAVTVIATGLVWFRVWEPFPNVSLIGIAGVLFGGWPIFNEAFENLRDRRMTMELSMTIALFAALGIGEFFTALVIAAFVLAAEVLEGFTVGRGRRAIGDLGTSTAVRLDREGRRGAG
jgi:Cd2+/Zn2+-exporting ATPase/Cu+-exporting ATPase